MRICNQGGFIHDNITRLRLEEDFWQRGRAIPIHRIIGYDADRDQEFVLDWGINKEQVQEYFSIMNERLVNNDPETWFCKWPTLRKEEEKKRPVKKDIFHAA